VIRLSSYTHLLLSALLLASLVIRTEFGWADSYMEEARLERAQAIADQSLLIDTHIDVPYRLQRHWEDVSQATEKGEFDFPRAKAGGLNIPFMSIYIPASYEVSGGGKALADVLIDQVEAMVARAPEKFTKVTDVQSMRQAFAAGKIGLALGMENGTAIEGSLDNLRHFYHRGIRYITLAHSKANHIADSSYDKHRLWQGVSPFGKRLITEMNRLGIMVDISHVSDAAFYEVLEISAAPVIASHSSLRHFTPGFERNMSDEMVKALAAKDGVVMINFGSSFVTQKANDYSAAFKAAKKAFMAQHAIGREHEKVKVF